MRESHYELHPTNRTELPGSFCVEHCATLCTVDRHTALNMHCEKIQQLHSSLMNPDNN